MGRAVQEELMKRQGLQSAVGDMLHFQSLFNIPEGASDRQFDTRVCSSGGRSVLEK